MKEMHEIVAAWHARATEPGGSEAVLATVVKVEGSSYRRAGARMLIFADGRSVGTISGGDHGTETVEWWFRRSGPIPFRLVLVSRTSRRVLLKQVHYREDADLRLSSTSPER